MCPATIGLSKKLYSNSDFKHHKWGDYEVIMDILANIHREIYGNINNVVGILSAIMGLRMSKSVHVQNQESLGTVFSNKSESTNVAATR